MRTVLARDQCLPVAPRTNRRSSSAMRPTASELKEMLARAHGPGAVLRLGDKLCWRIVAMAGMEEYLLRITGILGLLPEHGGRTLHRLILAVTEGHGAKVSAAPPGEDRSGNGDGWQRIELPELHVYIRKGPPEVICELQTRAVVGPKDGWVPSVLLPVYLRVIETGGLVLHAAAVERDGEAVLLPGKSGAGKSTCCRRIVPPWRALCDDLCLAVPGSDSGFLVHPLPTWSDLVGKGREGTWHVEQGVYPRGIFFLEHGEGDELLPLGKAEASVHLWKAAVGGTLGWRGGLDVAARRSMEEQILETAMRVVKMLPAFRLRVARDGAFWKEIEAALTCDSASARQHTTCIGDR